MLYPKIVQPSRFRDNRHESLLTSLESESTHLGMVSRARVESTYQKHPMAAYSTRDWDSDVKLDRNESASASGVGFLELEQDV